MDGCGKQLDELREEGRLEVVRDFVPMAVDDEEDEFDMMASTGTDETFVGEPAQACCLRVS